MRIYKHIKIQFVRKCTSVRHQKCGSIFLHWLRLRVKFVKMEAPLHNWFPRSCVAVLSWARMPHYPSAVKCVLLITWGSSAFTRSTRTLCCAVLRASVYLLRLLCDLQTEFSMRSPGIFFLTHSSASVCSLCNQCNMGAMAESHHIINIFG